MLCAIAFGGLILYLYCYYGKLASDFFTLFDACLYESNWMVLTNDLQKTFILMIAYGQRRIFYHGYGFVELNLETFLKVKHFLKIIFY